MSASISAIVVAVGPQRVVDRAIAAAARQACADLEVVVVHDGVDESRVRHDAESAGLTGCRYVACGHQEPGVLRNAGVRASTAPYFAILDGSEEPRPEYLSHACRALEEAPHAGFATTPVVDSIASALIADVGSHTIDLPTILGSPWSIACAALIRRASLDRCGGFDESLPAFVEWDCFLTLAENGEHGLLQSPALLERYGADDVRMRQTLRVDRHLPAVRRILAKHRASFDAHAASVLPDRDRIAKAIWIQERELAIRRDRLREDLSVASAELDRLRAALAAHSRSTLEWADLERTTPLSRNWGLDRGCPIDRHYIYGFMAKNSADVRGRVLEVLDADLTTQYGGDRVRRSDVLDIDPANSRATVIADLRAADNVPSNTYDCFILTQTLHLLDDPAAAIHHAYRILKPGGVLLATFPCASMVASEYGSRGDHWRVTEAGARQLLARLFGEMNLEVESHGNVQALTAFLYGLAVEDIDRSVLAVDDPDYPLLVTVRAVKAATERSRPAVAARRGAAVLLYHRIATLHYDRHGLTVSADAFRSHVEQLCRRWRPMPLRDLADQTRNGEPPDGGIAVTFDDGYLDNLVTACPILGEFGVPATMFLASERLTDTFRFWWDVLESIFLQDANLPTPLAIRVTGQSRSFATRTDRERQASHDELYAILKVSQPAVRDDIMRQLSATVGLHSSAVGNDRPMIAEEIRRLAALPGIEIGAHGVHHVSLPGLPREQMHREIFESRSRLERLLAQPVASFAFPYGDVSSDCVEMVRAADFSCSVTCEPRSLQAHDDVFRLPRLQAPTHSGDDFAAWLSLALVDADRPGQ
jgi:peptidoglycan/xylan/chitin deacetylase (PgdA/CDA1 family)/SAM-dependent methyltransferase